MRRANTISDMPIRYGPNECDIRCTNTLWATQIRYETIIICFRNVKKKKERKYDTLWAAWMRYAIRKYATGARMWYAICEYFMSRANAICDTRIGYALWAIAIDDDNHRSQRRHIYWNDWNVRFCHHKVGWEGTLFECMATSGACPTYALNWSQESKWQLTSHPC